MESLPTNSLVRVNLLTNLQLKRNHPTSLRVLVVEESLPTNLQVEGNHPTNLKMGEVEEVSFRHLET